MVGDVVLVDMPFYDVGRRANSFKRRPALVIGDAASNDYTILPVSKVKNANDISTTFDVRVEPQIYPLLRLKLLSYVRTHKVTTVHRVAMGYRLSSMKESYPDLFLTVMEKFEEYTQSLITDSL